MITAVDTSAILAIFKREASAEGWLLRLAEAARSGPLVISEVVYAELAAFFVRAEDLEHQLENLGIDLLPSSRQTLFSAGQIHSDYRRSGGARTTMVPDFLIGAHALVQANRLASVDRGYLRKHFTGLQLLSADG
jgi:predicted nucleic acid-binding protein